MDSIYRDAYPDVFSTCDFEPWDLIVVFTDCDEETDDVDKDKSKSMR